MRSGSTARPAAGPPMDMTAVSLALAAVPMTMPQEAKSVTGVGTLMSAQD